MANLKQSKKRIRQDKKRRFINKVYLSMIRISIKKFLKLLYIENFKLASTYYSILTSRIDKGVNKGVCKKNRANRMKKRLNFKLKILKGM